MARIQINDTYSIERSPTDWVLYTTGTVRDKKTGKQRPSKQPLQSYWSTLPSVCNAIIDRSCSKADSVVSILGAIQQARAEILKALGGYTVTERELKKGVPYCEDIP